MSDQRTLTVPMLNPVQAHKALNEKVWPYVKAMTAAEHRMEVIVRPAKRSTEHNARLHATISWVAEHVEWAGRLQDIECWKRLFVAAWDRARGSHVEYLPALDGNGIDLIFRRTSELSGRDMADLITYIYAWGDLNGYDIPEYQRDPITGELVQVRRDRPITEAA